MALLSQYSGLTLPYDFRNKIINGAMVIDQRQNGGTITVTNDRFFVTDRWLLDATATSVNAVKSTDAPVGFSNSLLITNNTVVSPSLSPNMYCTVTQRIESLFTGDFLYGTENAKPITISFWVKSSETGFYSILWSYYADNIQDTLSYKARYYVNFPDTWEKKTITIPGNKVYRNIVGQNGTGPIMGGELKFILASGNNLNTSTLNEPGPWELNSTTIGYTAAAYITRAVGITFNITGVQVETRATATPFEYRPIEIELDLCQRYYCQPTVLFGSASQSGNLRQTYYYPTIMAYTPSVSSEAYLSNAIDLITPSSVRVLAWTAGGNNTTPVHNYIYSLNAEI